MNAYTMTAVDLVEKYEKQRERERESILPKWQDGQHQHKTDNMQANKMNMFTCT